MAAPTAPRGPPASSPPGFEGFPFAVASRPSEDSSGKEPAQTGDVKKKPCRACTDFKSWMKVQKKQTTAATQVVSYRTGDIFRSLSTNIINCHSPTMLFFLVLYYKVFLLLCYDDTFHRC